MPNENNDLMNAVGESFGIPDTPPQQQDGGDQQDQGQDQGQGAESTHESGDFQGQQPPQQPAQRADGQSDTRGDKQQRKEDQLFSEKPKRGPRGELLDKHGNVVASTRREKQLAFNLNRAQFAANQLTRSNRQLLQTLEQYKGIDQQIKQHGLSLDQTREALELRALAEKDPVMAVRDIVARVLASGVTMEQLFGGDAVPSINARVITSELDRRLGPMEKQQQQTARQTQIAEQAQEQTERFIADHPYSEIHGADISNLVEQYNMSPQKAYYELRSWSERRGFDFTQPLRPQIEAAMQRRGGQGQQQQRRVQSTPGDMRGVAPNGGHTTETQNRSRGDFKSNAPWRDIASAVFAELNPRR